jgi:hypothetical protein
VLPSEQLTRINEALLDIVENLEAVDGAPDQHAGQNKDSPGTPERPTEPARVPPVLAGGTNARPATGSAAAVMCIPGRGAFDQVVAAIVTQLLERHSIHCTGTTYEQFRNGNVSASDFNNAAMICVLSLDAAESPPYLRNLLRRVIERRVTTEIVVGLTAQAPEGLADLTQAPGTRGVPTLRALIDECRLIAFGPAAVSEAPARQHAG